MKNIARMLMFCLLSPMALACDDKPRFPLDKVVFQVSAKEWVTTETALLTVDVNATLSNADLVKARADIMDRLNKIAKGEWHLTQFDRSQDNSGLEKLFVEAQARVPQATLTDIYQNAKKVSLPGAAYTINAVEFKPSLLEIQKIKTTLREKLYQQVNDELARLNKTYTTQSYTVNRMYLIDGEALERAPLAMRKDDTMMLAATASPTPNVAVSNELTMSAVVEAGSNRLRSASAAVSN